MGYNQQTNTFTTELYVIDYNTGDYTDYTSALRGIAINKNFIENVYPLYVLSLKLTYEQKNYLAQNKFYLALKIFRCVVSDDDQNNEETLATDPITDKVVTDIILRPFNNDKRYENIRSADVASDRNEEETVLENQYIYYTLNCVPKEQLKINNTIINECYEDANINEALINIVSENYSKDLYLQESSNTNRYKSIIIPPMSMIEAIKFLQDNYSIYKKSLNMFFEYDKMYLYDLYDINKEYRNNLFLEISYDSDTDNTDKFKNIFIDENDDIKKYLNTDPVFISIKDTYRYSTGENLTISSYDDNFNIINRHYVLHETGNNSDDMKSRYRWNPDLSYMFEEKALNGAFMYITQSFSNFDFSLIEPDTKVLVSGSKVDDINGTYSVGNVKIYLSSTDGKNYNDRVVIDLLNQEE